MPGSSNEDLKTRLAAATAERDFFRAILDAMNSITILVVDTVPLAQIRFVNAFGCYITGVSFEQAITMNAYDVAPTPDDDINKINAAIEKVMKGEGPAFIEGYFRSRGARAEAMVGFLIVQRLDRPGASPCLLFTTIDKSRFQLDGDNPDMAANLAGIKAFLASNPPAPHPTVDFSNQEDALQRIAEMERERDFFKQIMDAMHYISLMVADTVPLAQLRFANHYFCRHNGVEYEKAITMNAYEFASTPDDDVEKINAAIGKAMAGGGPVVINGYFRSRGEEALQPSLWATMIIQRLDLPGKPPRIMFTTIGLSELGIGHGQVDVSFARVQAVTTATNDAVALLDADGKVTFWNVMAEKMFGVVANRAMGSPLPELVIPVKLRDEFQTNWQARVNPDNPPAAGNLFEATAVGRDGLDLPLEVSAGPLRLEGGAWGAVGFFRDITARKKMEADLLAAMDQAVNANRLKDQFVALVSHDLRSPLGNVIGMLEMFKSKTGGQVKPETMFYLNRAMENCNSLMGMVNRLLDITRLQSGKVKLRKRFITARPFIMELVENVSHLAGEKGIAIRVDVPEGMRIFADDGLLGQVFQNLLGNAIKFLRKGDVVTVAAPDGKPGTIVVKDNGPGILDKFLPNLFTHEVKTSTPGARGEKGMGLGLPMCADIMKAHGGSIKVESATGKGCLFHIALPEARALALVVDDQDSARQEMAEHIRALGAEALEAANGREAMDILDETMPQLVVTDVMMPVVDGWELLKLIRQIYPPEALPVIVMTSSGQREAREIAFSLGANDFALKPIIADEFVPRVRRFLG